MRYDEYIGEYDEITGD